MTVGSFVLLLSLSIGVGVREAVSKQIRRHDELRKIESARVTARSRNTSRQAKLIVKGEMSDAKRRRLRERLVQRWIAKNGYPPTTP